MISYPKYIEYDGKRYGINTDFRVALRVLDIIEDDSISDYERSIGVIVSLFGRECPVNNGTLKLAEKYLQCGIPRTEHKQREPDMDFNYDSRYIVSSFQKEYGIDIVEGGMHWWKFFSLVEGLGEDCVLSRVRQLRNEDIGAIKDSKARRKLAEAKKQVALPTKYTKEQRERREEFMRELKGSGKESEKIVK